MFHPPFLRLFLLLSLVCGQPLSQVELLADPKGSQETSAIASSSATDQVVTEWIVRQEGHELRYEAVASLTPLLDDKGSVEAALSSFSYWLLEIDGIAVDRSSRPVTFCFNGGPGSSSAWLHLGAFGPKRIAGLSGANATLVPPYELEDNPFHLLKTTDLVFIDPVSTGWSRAIGGVDASRFHNAEADVASIGQFIERHLRRWQLWQRPKFLMGESYGGFRMIDLALYLRYKSGIELNGMIAISPLFDYAVLHRGRENASNLTFVLQLPSYAAIAWHEGRLSDPLQALSLPELLSEAEEFAFGPYATALLQGDRLPEKSYRALIDQLHRWTGLPFSLLERQRGRISPSLFRKELLATRGKSLGRMDMRWLALDPGQGEELADPSLHGLIGAFTAVAESYFSEGLQAASLWKSGVERPFYEVLFAIPAWSFGRAGENQLASVTPALRRLLMENSRLTLFTAAGIYDLAIPYLTPRYSLDQLMLPTATRSQLYYKSYASGHMIYFDEKVHRQLLEDLVDYYRLATIGDRE